MLFSLYMPVWLPLIVLIFFFLFSFFIAFLHISFYLCLFSSPCPIPPPLPPLIISLSALKPQSPQCCLFRTTTLSSDAMVSAQIHFNTFLIFYGCHLPFLQFFFFLPALTDKENRFRKLEREQSFL